MPLTIGSKLGPYEIVAAVGAGGMSARGRSARAQRPFGKLRVAPSRVEGRDALPRVGVGPHAMNRMTARGERSAAGRSERGWGPASTEKR